MKKATVLVVDDDTDVLTAARLLLKTEVREVITEKNPENLNALLQRKQVDVVLLDMNFNSVINTGNEGLYWLRRIKEWKPDARVIMITGYGDIDLAVRSLKEGAENFMVKPWRNEKLLEALRELIDTENPSAAQKRSRMNHAGDAGIIGESESMRDIFHKLEKIAPTDANILILGENGTGKDLIAKAIHDRSLRSAGPFVKVDLGALTESLFESELFGHKKGAYTDAREDRPGRFEEANGGTLFLDEIGNISLPQQAKLLTALQNRQVTRVGSNQAIPVDIRLISATNMPLQALVNENRFRKDLIYRINTVEVNIPPLRSRGEDAIVLAKHFAVYYAAKYAKPPVEFDASAVQKLRGYHFPGNVRELQYLVERAVIMAENSVLRAEDLLYSSLESPVNDENTADTVPLSTLERNAILRVIEKNSGNITKAAKELGLTRTALYRRLSKYDI